MSKFKGLKLIALMLVLAMGVTLVESCSSSRKRKTSGSKISSSGKIGNKRLGKMLKNVD